MSCNHRPRDANVCSLSVAFSVDAAHNSSQQHRKLTRLKDEVKVDVEELSSSLTLLVITQDQDTTFMPPGGQC